MKENSLIKGFNMVLGADIVGVSGGGGGSRLAIIGFTEQKYHKQTVILEEVVDKDPVVMKEHNTAARVVIENLGKKGARTTDQSNGDQYLFGPYHSNRVRVGDFTVTLKGNTSDAITYNNDRIL